MNPLRILIVDDEADFRTPIKAVLEKQGMEVREAGTAAEMDTVLSRFDADILLLDVKLPDETGLEIAHRLKQTRAIDIVMLSALGEVEQRVEGLTSGADYYLPKPVDLQELLAVIRSRSQRRDNQNDKSASWQYDSTKWLLITPDGKSHTLSKSEWDILSTLISLAGKPVSRQQLYTALGTPDYPPESRMLDIRITRIRQRFTTDNYAIPIKTVRNVGYMFNDAIRVYR